MALLVAALEARDGDTVVTNMTNVTNVTMTNIACPNGSFPDYGENATSPEGLDLCVKVHSMVWFVAAGSMVGLVQVAMWRLDSLVVALRLKMHELKMQFHRFIGTDERTEQPTRSHVESSVEFWDRLELESTSEFAAIIIIVTNLLFLGGFQRDYDVGFYVLMGLCCLVILEAELTEIYNHIEIKIKSAIKNRCPFLLEHAGLSALTLPPVIASVLQKP